MGQMTEQQIKALIARRERMERLNGQMYERAVELPDAFVHSPHVQAELKGATVIGTGVTTIVPAGRVYGVYLDYDTVLADGQPFAGCIWVGFFGDAEQAAGYRSYLAVLYGLNV